MSRDSKQLAPIASIGVPSLRIYDSCFENRVRAVSDPDRLAPRDGSIDSCLNR
jgi:hypothetical protein